MATCTTFIVFFLIGLHSVTEVSSACSDGNESVCIDITNDSICSDYRGSRSYLNYTTDIDMLQQLELDAIDYIESNISSEMCRDYLMAAICVTIYPPCTESGTVQQLCPEQCNAMLDETTCMQDAIDVTEYINQWTEDPVFDFVLNCSNSLSFAELYVGSLICIDEHCFSTPAVGNLTNSTDTDNGTSTTATEPHITTGNPTTQVPVPNSCIQIDAISDSACNSFSKTTNNFVFKYTTLDEFAGYIDTLNGLESIFNSADEDPICQEAAGRAICNYVLIPCNLTNGNPRPICTLSCNYYFNIRCHTIFDTVVRFSSIIRYPFMNNCQNTLSHLSVFGYNLSSSNYADDCIDLAAVIEPSLVLTNSPNPTANGGSNMDSDSNSSSNSVVVIGVSVLSGLLVLAAIVLFTAMFLVVRHKRKVKKYSTMGITSVIYNHNGVQIIGKQDSPDHGHGQIADGYSALTTEDLNLLRKEFGNDFTELLLPGYQVDLNEVLGEGEFGRVFKGVWTHQDADGRSISEDVAVKTIRNYNSLDKLKAFLRESAVMQSFHHPNVLQVLGISLETEDGLPYIVLPYMANGDLKTFLKSKRPEALVVDQFPEDLGETKLIMICYQIACGMSYLAGKKVVHRDLAARNCMVDGKLNVRVADFGLARDVYATDYYRQQSTGKIPVKWMAPETLNDRVSNEKTDVWSYGVTCWEIFSLGRTPYPTIPNHEIPQYVETGNRLTKPQLCPDKLYSLMLECWEEDAEKRLCFTEIITEINELISFDDGYIIDNPDAQTTDSDYIIDNPSAPATDNGYTVDNLTSPDDDYANA